MNLHQELQHLFSFLRLLLGRDLDEHDRQAAQYLWLLVDSEMHKSL